jgi:hypothetical protein
MKFSDYFINAQNDTSNIEHITLQDNHYWPVILTDALQRQHDVISFQQDETSKQNLTFSLKLTKDSPTLSINVTKSGLNGYYVTKKNYQDDLIICETVSQFDKKRIYLRSSVQIKNQLNIDVDIEFEYKTNVMNRQLMSSKRCFVTLDMIYSKMFKKRPIK